VVQKEPNQQMYKFRFHNSILFPSFVVPHSVKTTKERNHTACSFSIHAASFYQFKLYHILEMFKNKMIYLVNYLREMKTERCAAVTLRLEHKVTLGSLITLCSNSREYVKNSRCIEKRVR